MEQNQICNICKSPEVFAASSEQASVSCHVRMFAADRFTVWRCGKCSSLHSLEDADLDLYYRHYPLQQHKLDFHARIGYRNRLRMLRRFGLRPPHRILDYGCGKGLFVQFLKEKGYLHAIGYDPYVAEYSKAEVLAETYDVVTSYDVIEHVADPRAYLSQLVSLVNPGGMLVIGTPNADEIELSGPDFPATELSQPYHRHILSLRALLRLAEEQNLAIADVYHRFYFDSLMPLVNTRFMWEYIRQTGGMIDIVVEPPKFGVLFGSFRLLMYGFLGYFMPPPGNMLITFRKRPETTSRADQPRLSLSMAGIA